MQACMSMWLQSCLTLCHPVDHNPPGSHVHGILQAWILGWVAMPPSRVSSPHRDWTHISHLAGGFFTIEPPEKPNMCSTGVNSFATFCFFQNEVLIFQSSLSWKFSSFKIYFLALKIYSLIIPSFLECFLQYALNIKYYFFSFNFTLDQIN